MSLRDRKANIVHDKSKSGLISVGGVFQAGGSQTTGADQPGGTVATAIISIEYLGEISLNSALLLGEISLLFVLLVARREPLDFEAASRATCGERDETFRCSDDSD